MTRAIFFGMVLFSSLTSAQEVAYLDLTGMTRASIFGILWHLLRSVTQTKSAREAGLAA
jgi:hypothetical protein